MIYPVKLSHTRKIILSLALFTYFISLTSVTADEETPFIDGFSDVPLLPGFSLVADRTMIYDAPSGTIAIAAIASDLTPFEGFKRYRQSLLSLGWECRQEKNKMRCKNASSILEITAEKNKKLQQYFSLKSVPLKE
ncbi:hypothetical protein QGN29_05355 [Temperatibacter marinus]|uniref:UrcA family protein n=1 Tax=Temperatibacter marinus TaxID=1456591 RepID=A0AA52HBJ0_9PROT|nr:hypothetical protein [Temperatibacter marinus]WND03800.1 hypothetical protein QGN29_05355 [Temperatibacter marinus]